MFCKNLHVEKLRLLTGSVSERFNHNENLSDERYDKFNEMITLTSNNER